MSNTYLGEQQFVKAYYKATSLCVGTRQFHRRDLNLSTAYSSMYPPVEPFSGRMASFTVPATDGDPSTKWRDELNWTDQDNIFRLLDALRDDINYVRMSLEGAQDLPDHIIESGKLARLQILWDGDFLEKLDMWESLILYCRDNNIDCLCGFAYHEHFQLFIDVLLITYDAEGTIREKLGLESNTPYLKPLYAKIISVCGHCVIIGEAIPAMARCGKCRVTTYCCEDHQALHWEIHKPFCKIMRKLRPDRISPEDLALITCKDCGCNSRKLLKCSRCMKVSYCSKASQIKDWKRHRLICVPQTDGI